MNGLFGRIPGKVRGSRGTVLSPAETGEKRDSPHEMPSFEREAPVPTVPGPPSLGRAWRREESRSWISKLVGLRSSAARSRRYRNEAYSDLSGLRWAFSLGSEPDTPVDTQDADPELSAKRRATPPILGALASTCLEITPP